MNILLFKWTDSRIWILPGPTADKKGVSSDNLGQHLYDELVDIIVFYFQNNLPQPDVYQMC